MQKNVSQKLVQITIDFEISDRVVNECSDIPDRRNAPTSEYPPEPHSVTLNVKAAHSRKLWENTRPCGVNTLKMTVIWNLGYISTDSYKLNTALQQEEFDDNAQFHGVIFMTPRRKTYEI